MDHLKFPSKSMSWILPEKNPEFPSAVYWWWAELTFILEHEKSISQKTWARDWRNSTKEKPCLKLARLSWNFSSDSVQTYWDWLDNQLVGVVDELAPLVIRSYNIIKDQLPQSSSRPRSCSCSRKQSNQESEVADRKQDEIDKELKRIRQRETTGVKECWKL